MKYLPVQLNLKDRRVLVVGGGRVAERKIQTLLEYTDTLTVVAPEVTDGINALVAGGRLCHHKRKFKKSDLTGIDCVFTTVDDPTVSRFVYTESKALNILVNTADVPALCDFILPATVRRGDLSISVSTNGVCPAVARRLREKLADQYSQEYAVLVALMGEIRAAAIQNRKTDQDIAQQLHGFLEELAPLLTWIKQKDPGPICQRIARFFDFEIDVALVLARTGGHEA
ncbi:MAG: bifunctional precorrin-2 dehydrogenase/sirohydrochlorin ferrochelatase [Deltaproteobacteria bacterium]|nr:bifunctional precorrin-2 dehydrogenase/sirohydrochlorin ferrochelatase [Deltaproteobacteria bacterium]